MELVHNRRSSPVQLASSRDLCDIDIFLRGELPRSCEVYFHVHTLVTAPHGDSRFYFIREQDTYRAIVGLTLDHYESQHGLRKFWTISQWAKNAADVVSIFADIGDVDWVQDAFNMYGIGHEPNATVRAFFESRELRMDVCSMDWFVLDAPIALTLDISLPDGVYVKSLERYHAPLVYEEWPWKTWTTVEQVAREIDQLPSGGVFLKENDQLVSWVMGYVPNGLSRLNTLQEHRRRGYAALAIKYMAKRMAQNGCPPVADVLVGNKASQTLFESIGFRKIQPAHHFYKFP